MGGATLAPPLRLGRGAREGLTALGFALRRELQAASRSWSLLRPTVTILLMHDLPTDFFRVISDLCAVPIWAG